MPAMRSGVRVSRSSMAGRMPASLAAATSWALAASHASRHSVSTRAMASSAAFFWAVPAVARVRAAALAAAPWDCSVVMIVPPYLAAKNRVPMSAPSTMP